MVSEPPHVIWLQPDAPHKPAEGAPCNGCGLCCLAEPCPLGMVISRRRHGACDALRWDVVAGRYWCGVLHEPAAWLPAWARAAAPALRWLAQRWIAAGVGCDAALEAVKNESKL